MAGAAASVSRCAACERVTPTRILVRAGFLTLPHEADGCQAASPSTASNSMPSSCAAHVSRTIVTKSSK